MRAYDLPNYDSWLNSNNPYDLADEEEQEREWLLEEIKEFDGDEDAGVYNPVVLPWKNR